MERILPFVFWALLILLATGGAWVIVTQREAIPEDAIAPEPENAGEIPPAVVDDPVFEEVSADGSVRWTLYLDQVIREEGGVMELQAPRALYRLESGETLEVQGESGTFNENDGILTLRGGVTGKARGAALSFSVGEMIWDSDLGYLTASGGVDINREGVHFNGEELKLYLSDEFGRIELTGGIEITTAAIVLEELEQGEL